MATQLRLDKLLSDTGRWSRKEAKLLLKQGRVRVDAQVERAAERKNTEIGEDRLQNCPELEVGTAA